MKNIHRGAVFENGFQGCWSFCDNNQDICSKRNNRGFLLNYSCHTLYSVCIYAKSHKKHTDGKTALLDWRDPVYLPS